MDSGKNVSDEVAAQRKRAREWADRELASSEANGESKAAAGKTPKKTPRKTDKSPARRKSVVAESAVKRGREWADSKLEEERVVSPKKTRGKSPAAPKTAPAPVPESSPEPMKPAKTPRGKAKKAETPKATPEPVEKVKKPATRKSTAKKAAKPEPEPEAELTPATKTTRRKSTTTTTKTTPKALPKSPEPLPAASSVASSPAPVTVVPNYAQETIDSRGIRADDILEALRILVVSGVGIGFLRYKFPPLVNVLPLPAVIAVLVIVALHYTQPIRNL